MPIEPNQPDTPAVPDPADAVVAPVGADPNAAASVIAAPNPIDSQTPSRPPPFWSWLRARAVWFLRDSRARRAQARAKEKEKANPTRTDKIVYIAACFFAVILVTIPVLLLLNIHCNWGSGYARHAQSILIGTGTTPTGPIDMRWMLEAPDSTAKHLPKKPTVIPEDILVSLGADDVAAMRAFSRSYYTLRLRKNPAAERHTAEWFRHHQSKLGDILKAHPKDVPDPQADVAAQARPGDFFGEAYIDLAAEDRAEEVIQSFNNLDPVNTTAFNLQKRWQSLLKHNTDVPAHNRVAVPRLMQMGVDGQGRFSVSQALSQWRGAGLTPIDGLKAMELLRSWMALDWSVFEGARPQRQTRMLTDAATAFHQMESLRDKGDTAPDRSDKKATDDALWETLQRDAEAIFTKKDLSPPAGLTMDQALRELEVAARASDLNTLRLHVSVFSSPQKVWTVAQELTQINKELQQATGWTGGVLGLGGRLDLTLSKPLDIGAAGVMKTTPDGRILVTGALSTLGHEWFHALDFAAAQQAFTYVPVLAYTDPEITDPDFPTLARLPDVVQARAALTSALNNPKSVWFQNRTNTGSPYWLRSTEAAAFAFQSLLISQNSVSAGGAEALPAAIRAYNPQRSPSSDEIAVIGDRFEELFRSLDGMDWTGRPPPFEGFQREQEPTWFAKELARRQTDPVM